MIVEQLSMANFRQLFSLTNLAHALIEGRFKPVPSAISATPQFSLETRRIILAWQFANDFSLLELYPGRRGVSEESIDQILFGDLSPSKKTEPISPP
jgi:hypothetical protein